MSARNTPKVASRTLAKSTPSLLASTSSSSSAARANAAARQPPTPAARQTSARKLAAASSRDDVRFATHSGDDNDTNDGDDAALNTGFAATKQTTSKLPTLQTPLRKVPALPALATPKANVRGRIGAMTTSMDARMTPESGPPSHRPQRPAQQHPALFRSNTADEMLVTAAAPASQRKTPAANRANVTALATPGGGCSGGDEASALTVAVRVRPLNARELAQPGVQNVLAIGADNATLTARYVATADGNACVQQQFRFDRAFWSCNEEHANYAGQRRVFEGTALPLIDSALKGYNACLFAYGQTGSGKSYSMMGIDADDSRIEEPSEAGIIPRFCQELYERIDAMRAQHTRVEVAVSYFEIYNEKIYDLLTLAPTGTTTTTTTTNAPASGASSGTSAASAASATSAANKRPALRVREHPDLGPYVVDLTERAVDSHSQLRNWLVVGSAQRATAATGMNDLSSRSHAIFEIKLSVTDDGPAGAAAAAVDGLQGAYKCKISLVDLAGSERVNLTAAKGERLREGVSINKSLLILGKVIASLAESGKRSTFVPYRESVLTWLLRENLGGNSRTCMLATISPASCHIDETLSTLRYASQASTIVNRVRVNEDPHGRRIRELHAQIERLQVKAQETARLERLRQSTGLPAQPRKIIIETMPTAAEEAEFHALRLQLVDTQEELEYVREQLLDMQQAEQAGGPAVQRTTATEMLRWNDYALEFAGGQTEPCLVNLAPDLRGGAALLWRLPLGRVRIGRDRPSAFEKMDITLRGDATNVAFEHCAIENKRGDLYIEPLTEEFETLLNGDQVQERTRLFHGDRIVIGSAHYFRVSNPHCVQRFGSAATDVQYSFNEVLRKKEQLIRARFEAERERIEQTHVERTEMLQRDREQLDFEREKLALERKKFDEEHPQQPTTPIAELLLADTKADALLFERLRCYGQQPSAEQLEHIDEQLAEARRRSAALCRRCERRQPFEFERRVIPTGFGTYKAVCNIIDTRMRTVAEWPPARLDVWLERLSGRGSLAEDEDTRRLFSGFDMLWFAQSEYELQCAEAEANASILNESVVSQSPRESLAANSSLGSPSKNAGRQADAGLLRTALMNTAQNTHKEEGSKRRLYSSSSQMLMSENTEPTLHEEPTAKPNTSKFVRMEVE